MTFKTVEIELDDEIIREAEALARKLQMTFDTYVNVALLESLSRQDTTKVLQDHLAAHSEITKPLELEEAWRILGRA